MKTSAAGIDADRLPALAVTGVMPGDLLFCNRRYWLQSLCDLAHDPWAHVGLVGSVDGEKHIIEFGPRGFSTRPLEVLSDRYRYVGVGRVNWCPACREAVVDRALLEGRQWRRFSWSQTVAVALGSFAADRLPARVNRAVLPLHDTAADHLPSTRRDNLLICASFVLRALQAACGRCGPTVEPLHGVAAPSSQRRTEAFASPSDLWRASGLARYRLVDAQPHPPSSLLRDGCATPAIFPVETPSGR